MVKIIGHTIYIIVLIFVIVILGALFSMSNAGFEASQYQVQGHMGEVFGPWLIPVGFFLYLALARKGWLPFVSKK